MTSRNPPTSATRVLRLAVVTNDSVCSEVHQTAPKGLTVGHSYRSDLLVGGPGTPATHRLFDVRNGAYFLDVPAGARGKIRLGGKAMSIAQLRKRFGQGDVLRLKLSPKAKGKLKLGDSTILFQFDRPKPPEPRLPFPTIFRASVFAMVGSLFVYSQLVSAGVLGPFFAWAYFSPLPEEGEIEIDERFLVAMGAPKPKKLDEEEPEEEEEEQSELAKEDEDKVEIKKPKPKPERPVKLASKPKTYSQAAMKQARSVGVMRVLGTYGGKGPGTIIDRVGEGENNLDELFAKGMATSVMANGGPIGEFVPGGEGIDASGTAVATQGFETGGGPELAKKEVKTERKVRARVKSKTSAISGGGDGKALRATIGHRTSGLKTCYANEKRHNGSLGTGKHTYTIEINVMGRVTRVAIEEDTLGSSKVAACAKSRIKGWRFPMNGAEDAAEVTFSVVYSG